MLAAVQNENKWQIWKTITLGTHRTAADLLCFMKRNGWSMEYLHDHIIEEEVKVSPVEKTVDLVRLPFGPTHLLRIYENWRGLEMCPAEVGLQLRIQYPEQREQFKKSIDEYNQGFESGAVYPEKETVYIAMDPIHTEAFNGEEMYPLDLIFCLMSPAWLHLIPSHTGCNYRTNNFWVYVLPRN